MNDVNKKIRRITSLLVEAWENKRITADGKEFLGYVLSIKTLPEEE